MPSMLAWFSLFLQPHDVVDPVVSEAVEATQAFPQSHTQFHRVLWFILPLKETTVSLPKRCPFRSLIL
jgi:hypothetical protein